MGNAPSDELEDGAADPSRTPDSAQPPAAAAEPSAPLATSSVAELATASSASSLSPPSVPLPALAAISTLQITTAADGNGYVVFGRSGMVQSRNSHVNNGLPSSKGILNHISNCSFQFVICSLFRLATLSLALWLT